MKRSSALIVVLLLSAWGCSKKESSEAKSQDSDQSQQVQSVEPEIKGATPEDPGPIATVISPLAILKGQAKASTTKPDEFIPQEPLLIDHRLDLPSVEPKSVLHKIFSVSKYAQFAFVVPPHEGNAKLRGTLRSFTKRRDPDSTSGSIADVDLMLLNDQEFQDFLHGQPQTATYELDSVHNQMVDWRVPTTYADPQTYHLVFSNSGSGTKTKFVEADFTVSFE